LTNSSHARATHRAPTIRVAAHNLTALAEAGARGHSLSPLEVRAVCEALHTQARRVPTQFHSGGS
jgi:hypothetical protein